jgi:hypothetical protein
MVEGHCCDFGKDRGLFVKWRRPRMFDRGGAGSQPFIAWWTAGAALTRPWTAPWTTVHGSTVDRGQGVPHDLIWAVDRRSGGLGRMHARAAMGQRRPAEGRRRTAVARRRPRRRHSNTTSRAPNLMGKVPKWRGAHEGFNELLALAS